ncbi:hypothetical protein FPV67DRAFT_1779452, partial [Lyophyllum atratum]
MKGMSCLSFQTAASGRLLGSDSRNRVYLGISISGAYARTSATPKTRNFSCPSALKCAECPAATFSPQAFDPPSSYSQTQYRGPTCCK